MTALPPVPEPLILFDGICPLCSFWVQFAARRDRLGQLHFASVQSPAGRAILTALGKSTTEFDSFVLIEDGEALFKSAAFFALARHLTLPWSSARFFCGIPRPLADWLYDRIADNRYAVFGRRQSCLMPTADIAARFIDAGL